MAHTHTQVEWREVSSRLYDLGFERGWGCDVGTARSSMRLLLDVLQVRCVFMLCGL